MKKNNHSALQKAQTIQNEAAKLGFDWPHIQCVLDKLHEELKEFEEALTTQNNIHAAEELGDILFVCANLARHLKLNAESLMQQANSKFEKRFNGVKEKVHQSGKSWDQFSLVELEQFWISIKDSENNKEVMHESSDNQ